MAASLDVKVAGIACGSPAPPPPPAMDIVISFDVTGSMMPVLATVRENLERLTSTIFAGSGADIRMQVFAHGDYDSTPYQVMSTEGFTRDAAEVARFIRSVRAVHNTWNEGECYEAVLERCKGLDFRPEARKLLILVGDDVPHPPHFPQNAARVDWRQCARHLAEMDVRIYAVQCASTDVARARGFYRELASFHRLSRYIALEQFCLMAELVLGIFHSASDDLDALRAHEEQLSREGRRTRNMARAFATLRGGAGGGGGQADAEAGGEEEEEEEEDPTPESAAARASITLDPSRAVAVAAGRFQAVPVPANCSIRAFVESMGISFRAGRGFYELSKSESIGPRKEVVLEHRRTGDMYTGEAVRQLLRLSPGGTTRISAAHPCAAIYRIFVQSTSYNRMLVAGTRFLYELGEA